MQAPHPFPLPTASPIAVGLKRIEIVGRGVMSSGPLLRVLDCRGVAYFPASEYTEYTKSGGLLDAYINTA